MHLLPLLFSLPTPAMLKPDPRTSLALVATHLRDGAAWRPGRDGGPPGRPFRIVATLANHTAIHQPIVLWDPKNTEGSACLYVTLAPLGNSTAATNQFAIHPLAPPRAGGVPTAIMLPPGGTLILELDLTAATALPFAAAPKPPPPGAYLLRAVYESRLPAAGPVQGVWTGRLDGKALRITVAP